MSIENQIRKYANRNKIEYIKNPDPNMPNEFFRMLICGPSGSGKTSLVFDLITNRLAYDKIYVFADNLHQDAYEALRNYFIDIVEKMNKGKKKEKEMTDVSDIYEEYSRPIPLDEIPLSGQKLIIFDDLMCDKDKFELIGKYFAGSRNKRCSCIFLAQDYFKTDIAIRNNCEYYVMFNFSQKGVTRRIAQDLDIEVDDYKKYFRKKYDFILINRRTKKITKNLTNKPP